MSADQSRPLRPDGYWTTYPIRGWDGIREWERRLTRAVDELVPAHLQQRFWQRVEQTPVEERAARARTHALAVTGDTYDLTELNSDYRAAFLEAWKGRKPALHNPHREWGSRVARRRTIHPKVRALVLERSSRCDYCGGGPVTGVDVREPQAWNRTRTIRRGMTVADVAAVCARCAEDKGPRTSVAVWRDRRIGQGQSWPPLASDWRPQGWNRRRGLRALPEPEASRLTDNGITATWELTISYRMPATKRTGKPRVNSPYWKYADELLHGATWLWRREVLPVTVPGVRPVADPITGEPWPDCHYCGWPAAEHSRDVAGGTPPGYLRGSFDRPCNVYRDQGYLDWLTLAANRRRKSRPGIPVAVRRAVIARDGLVCRYCDRAVTDDGGADQLHLDHVLPWVQGGGHTVDNLVVSCRGCNLAKRARTDWTPLPPGGVPVTVDAWGQTGIDLVAAS